MIERIRERTASPHMGPIQDEGFRSREDGSASVEYGLIAALVVVVLIVTLSQLRTNLLSLPFPALFAAFQEALSS